MAIFYYHVLLSCLHQNHGTAVLGSTPKILLPWQQLIIAISKTSFIFCFISTITNPMLSQKLIDEESSTLNRILLGHFDICFTISNAQISRFSFPVYCPNNQ